MEGLTRLALAAPRATLALLLLATALLGAGQLRLRADTGFRAYLGAEHPVVRELDGFLERFGGGFPVAAVYGCEELGCASVFDPPILAMAAEIAHEMEGVPGVRHVESTATSALLVPSAEGFDVRRLVQDGAPAADRERLAARAVADPLWRGSLVSADARTAAIVLELASSESAESITVIHALRDALARFEAQGLRFHLVGQSVELLVTDEELAADSARLLPAAAALIAVIVFSLLRSWAAVVLCLGTMGLALAWTLGALGWIGWPQNSITQTIGPLILVIGVSDAIHVLARYAVEVGATGGVTLEERRRALLRVAGDVGNACAMTAATTAVGFLSFLTSGAESFVRFGVIAALGMGFALLLSFTLLPIVLVRLPVQRRGRLEAASRWPALLEGITAGALHRPGLVLGGAALLMLVLGAGLVRLRVDVDPYQLYGEHSRVVQWARFAEERLRKPDTLELELVLPEGLRLTDPAVLGDLARLRDRLAGIDGLGPARSLLDPLGRVNRMLHGDDPDFERPGSSDAANAELLLLLSLDDAAQLERWVSLDQRRVRFSVEASKEPQERRSAILEAVRGHVAAALGPGFGLTLTGPLAVYHGMVKEIQRTQLLSFGAADLVVLLLMALFLRSFGWALIGLLPNLLPILATLGVMGLTGINLDMGTAMVASIVLGISTDDTIHLLTQYRRRRRAGLSAEAGIRESLRHVGPAVVTTAFALALGFFVLSLSHWQSIASFGLFSGITLMVSLAADLFLLPAAIMLVSRVSLRRRISSEHPA